MINQLLTVWATYPDAPMLCAWVLATGVSLAFTFWLIWAVRS